MSLDKDFSYNNCENDMSEMNNGIEMLLKLSFFGHIFYQL